MKNSNIIVSILVAIVAFSLLFGLVSCVKTPIHEIADTKETVYDDVTSGASSHEDNTSHNTTVIEVVFPNTTVPEETLPVSETTTLEETTPSEETSVVDETTSFIETTEDTTSVAEETVQPEETSVSVVCNHKYDVTVIPASCLIGGYTEHVCTKCSYSYTDKKTAPLGHDYVKGETIEPTTQFCGYTVYRCSRCNLREDRDFTDEIPVTETPFDINNPDEYEHVSHEKTERSDACEIYNAIVRNPICYVIVCDYSLKATVVHTGYLTLEVTFVDNTDTEQKIELCYDRENDVIVNLYSALYIEIYKDGSYEVNYGTRIG